MQILNIWLTWNIQYVSACIYWYNWPWGMNETMHNAIIKQSTSLQCFWVWLKNMSIKDKPYDFLIRQFRAEISPKTIYILSLVNIAFNWFQIDFYFLKSPIASEGHPFTSFRSSFKYFNLIRNSFSRASLPPSPSLQLMSCGWTLWDDGAANVACVNDASMVSVAMSSITLPFSLFSFVQLSVLAVAASLSGELDEATDDVGIKLVTTRLWRMPSVVRSLSMSRIISWGPDEWFGREVANVRWTVE